MKYLRPHYVKFSQVFGSVVKTIRVQRGMTQEQLALDAGIDRGFISGIERGLRKPCLATIFQIAYGLELWPSELIRFTEEKLSHHE